MNIDSTINSIKGSYGDYKIVAVDFDKTLFDHSDKGYPHVGPPIRKTIELVKKLQAEGWKTILWTCRDGKELDMALDACSKEDLYFNAINDNIDKTKNNILSRKIYASLYIDDKSINPLII